MPNIYHKLPSTSDLFFFFNGLILPQDTWNDNIYPISNHSNWNSDVFFPIRINPFKSTLRVQETNWLSNDVYSADSILERLLLF